MSGNSLTESPVRKSGLMTYVISSAARNLEFIVLAVQWPQPTRFLTALRSVRNDMCVANAGRIVSTFPASILSTNYSALSTPSGEKNPASTYHIVGLVKDSRFLSPLRSVRNDMCAGRAERIASTYLRSNLSTNYPTSTGRMTKAGILSPAQLQLVFRTSERLVNRQATSSARCGAARIRGVPESLSRSEGR